MYGLSALPYLVFSVPLLGRILTLNMIQTKEGWTMAGGAILLILLAQLLLISKAVLQKRRHLRALEDVKKM